MYVLAYLYCDQALQSANPKGGPTTEQHVQHEHDQYVVRSQETHITCNAPQMQHSLAIEPLPQFAAHQRNSSYDDSQPSSSGQPAQPLCGAFDPQTCCLLLGCSSGTVSCIHLGRYGSTACRVLGRHAGRVTAACLFPWQAPEHIAAAATVVPCARVASFFATCSADASIKVWTSDAKALHTTDACLQTLRGHRAAVTSLAAVQVSNSLVFLFHRVQHIHQAVIIISVCLAVLPADQSYLYTCFVGTMLCKQSLSA